MDKRAAKLPREYRSKARNIDQRCLGVGEDQRGPLEQKLESFGDLQGIVIGQFGEGSQDLHKLLHTFASEKADRLGRLTGRPLSDNQRGLLLQQIRRQISVCSIRAQSSCLLSRLGHTGQGARQAAQRRSADLRKQELAMIDLKSHWESNIRGRRLKGIGSFHF